MERVFRRATMTSEGGPQPVIQPNEIATLSDTELANYLSASTYEFDGIGHALREAVVRLLLWVATKDRHMQATQQERDIANAKAGFEHGWDAALTEAILILETAEHEGGSLPEGIVDVRQFRDEK